MEIAKITRTPETSESLLLRLRDPEDRAAWQQFDAIYRPVVYRVARRAGWQDSDADDLTQQVMLSVAGAMATWKKDASKGGFRGWLNRVARNALISTIRKRRPDNATGESDFIQFVDGKDFQSDQLERLIQQEHNRSRLRQAAEEVSHEFQPNTWQAFWLTTLGELSVAEAAKQLNLSTGAVYAARSRIMRRLQERAMQDDCGGGNDDDQ